MSAPTDTDPVRITAQYEAMRAQALGGSAAVATPLGLAVFLRRGLVSWLAVCRELVSTPPVPTVPRFAVFPPAVLPGGVQANAVRVLASMALAAGQKGAT